MDLRLEVTEHDGVAVLGRPRRGRRVDRAPAAPAAGRDRVVRAGHRWWSISTPVEFLDSTGLGVLVSGLKRFRTLGGDLLARLQPARGSCRCSRSPG